MNGRSYYYYYYFINIYILLELYKRARADTFHQAAIKNFEGELDEIL